MATIIVMEDDEAVRGLVVAVLEMRDHTVEGFADAGPALETADFEQADLVITDLRMPTPGEEAIRTIRARGIQTPILVMSGHVDEAKADELLAFGNLGILKKPFQLEELLRVADGLI